MPTYINFKPTLFLFLGTTAGKIGWRVKKIFKEAYGIDVPIFKFLWLDIDPSEEGLASEWVKPDERILLRGDDVNLIKVIQNLNNYPQIKDWWPDEKNINPGILGSSGGSPKQMRLSGRLLLFRLFNEDQGNGSIKSRLDHACNQLNNGDEAKRVKTLSNDFYDFNVAPGIDIVMIFSPCGGTGSSIAFDIAEYARNKLPNATIYTYQPMPEVMDTGMKDGIENQKIKARANCYAWFKEDNYLDTNPNWRVRYESLPIYVENQVRPFDFKFLIDIKNKTGKRLSSEEEVFDTISESIFLNSLTDIRASLNQFEHNISISDYNFPEQNGRRRMYSSLAVTSLIFPKERLINYSANKLAYYLIKQGMLSVPSESETNASTSNLVMTLQLRDEQLISALKNGASIPLEYRPIIMAADDVEKARTLLSTQKVKADPILEDKINQIEKSFDEFKEKIKTNLESSIVNLVCNSGLERAKRILALLLKSGNELSLLHFQNKIREDLQEISNPQDLQRSITDALDKLIKVNDGLEDKFQIFFDPKGWETRFLSAKNDCLDAFEKYYQKQIDRVVMQKAIDIYTELIVFVSDLQKKLNQINTTLNEISENHKKKYESLLEINKQIVDDNFHITREIEIDLEQYYEQYIDKELEPSAILSSIIPASIQSNLDVLSEWVKKDLNNAFIAYGNEYFGSKSANNTAIEALKLLSKSKNVEPEKMIEKEIDELLEYCLPLLKYEQNTGLGKYEELDIISIGASDEEKKSIPNKYRNNSHYNLIYTGFKDRIDVLKEIIGIPAQTIEGMSEFKVIYEDWLATDRGKVDPLHILPDMDFAPDVFPETDNEVRAKILFYKSLMFDFIVEIDKYFYYDPDRLLTTRHIKPPKDQNLGNGWEKALDTLVDKSTWLNYLEDIIQDEIIKQGKDNIVNLIQTRIDQAFDTIRSINSNNSKTSRQLYSAIAFWSQWQIDLKK